MRTRTKRRVQPRVVGLEDRRLLSLAVVEILNKSTYNVTFEFQWTPSSTPKVYSLTPNQYELIWASYSSAYTPQVVYNTTSSPSSQTIVRLAQGYGEWDGPGNPPITSATMYDFANTVTGLQLYYGAPPTPTDAVIEIMNESTYNISFNFQWTANSKPTAITLTPGHGEIFWTSYATGLAPQTTYDMTTSSSSQITASMVQGYDEWTGNGQPPDSAAKPYEFQNTSTGVELYYGAAAPTPTPSPSPAESSSPNWSGYAISAQPNSVTSVYGTWNVPAVSAPPGGYYDSSTWVGIDGDNNQTVEQIGTEQDVVNGLPVYQVWWEMYSSGLKQKEQRILNMYILPGDSITATVQYVTSGVYAGQFYLAIVDNSRPNDSYYTYQSSYQTQYPWAQRSTAEWIMEAPSVNGATAELPYFSTVNFTNAGAVINGVQGGINSSAWHASALYVAQPNGTAVDTTSVLNSSGNGFSVSATTGVGAGDQSSSGPQTAQPLIGNNDPQAIVVGRQTPQPSARQLVIQSQPPAFVAPGSVFGLDVAVEDASGQIDTSYNGTVSLSLADGPGGASLGGWTVAPVVNGVAHFTNLTINQPGFGYLLQASAFGMTLATTTGVAVSSAPIGFDEQYYLATNPDVAAAVRNGEFASGYQHFLEYGQYEGRNPSPYFDTAYYLANNPDVAAAIQAGSIPSAFEHFLLYGQYEGRNPSPYFDTAYYLASNPDVAAAVQSGAIPSAFAHYILYGQHEGRNPTPVFDEQYYLANNPDVAAAVASGALESGYEHFVLYGQHEGRRPSPLYNESYYLANNPDVAAAVASGAFSSGYAHFMEYGLYEGRIPIPNWNEANYLADNPDVAAAVAARKFASGFEHYVLYGRAQGRTGGLT